MYPAVNSTIQKLITDFGDIPEARKQTLRKLSNFIQGKINIGEKASLIFICTHNSRRSLMAEIWARAAASYYHIQGIECFSGGTEATEFNLNAVKAIHEAGFSLTETKTEHNPVYEVGFSFDELPVVVFSKKYDDPFNTRKDFAAIMTCSDADENCPMVLGASFRIAITYDDPKEFDGTPRQDEKYRDRALEIGREMLYAFSQVVVREGHNQEP